MNAGCSRSKPCSPGRGEDCCRFASCSSAQFAKSAETSPEDALSGPICAPHRPHRAEHDALAIGDEDAFEFVAPAYGSKEQIHRKCRPARIAPQLRDKSATIGAHSAV